MKKLMILVSAIMMVATANAKRVETESFNEVRVNVPARVRIVAGEAYSVNINGVQENAIRVQVKDGVLTLNTRDLDALNNAENRTVITITTPSETKLSTGRSMNALAENTVAEKDLALAK